jgi:dTDP-glucose pyrophosphorylase
MITWENTLITPDATIGNAIEVITRVAVQVALVVDADRRLLGVITDGDIRRGLLKGVSLKEKVSLVMNRTPKTATAGTYNTHRLMSIMRTRRIHQLPLVDDSGRVVGLHLLDELLQAQKMPNWVVLMAGGLGTRLQPLTHHCPKPLLHVGDRPILETILDSYLDQGFSRFIISLNYKGEMIESYFGNGEEWGAEIHYIREKKRMGTAGPLSQLPLQPDTPFFVMNSDLLTTINYQAMLKFHASHGQLATMAVREFDMEVPFGVVKMDGIHITGIQEKPVHHFFVNAGIYLLDPKCLSFIPDDTFFNMPDLFQTLIQHDQHPSAFPLHEYWLDIGGMKELEQANATIHQVLGK